jgi:hypothetical protein
MAPCSLTSRAMRLGHASHRSVVRGLSAKPSTAMSDMAEDFIRREVGKLLRVEYRGTIGTVLSAYRQFCA